MTNPLLPCCLTAEGWGLYAHREEGAEVAAKRLCQAYDAAVACAWGRQARDDERASRAFQDVYEVMEELAATGACDTEPRGVLCDLLEKEFGRW